MNARVLLAVAPLLLARCAVAEEHGGGPTMALREAVAVKEAEATLHGYQETMNRVVRDVKIAYFDLAFVIEPTRLTETQPRQTNGGNEP